MAEHATHDWAESGTQPFAPLLPLEVANVILLSVRDGALSASHAKPPASDDPSDPPLDWQPFSFESFERNTPPDGKTALILLPSVASGEGARSAFLTRAWAMLRAGDALVLGSENAPTLTSYRLFRRLRTLTSGARAYTCLGRSDPETLLKLVSCRHDMQRHHFRNIMYRRSPLRGLIANLASLTGVYPWLVAEHVLVAEKC